MSNKVNSISLTKNRNSSKDAKWYLIVSLLVLIFGYIVGKDISLPISITVPIAVISLFVLLYLSFTNPIFSLMILTAYLPFAKVITGQFGMQIIGFNLSNILLIIVVLAWIFHSLGKNERIFNKNWLNPVIILFCVWGVFSVIRARFIYGGSYNLEGFFISFKRWATPVFLYFIGLNIVRDKEGLRKVMFVIMVTTFIVALMTVRDYMHYGDIGSVDASRIGGVFEQPNMLGAFFVYNMFFFLGFFLYHWRSFKYWLLLIPFLVCFRGIMVTFSRGAYIAFSFGSLATSFFKSKILFLVVLFFLILAILSPNYLPEGMRSRMASTFGGEKTISTNIEEVKDTSATNRMLIWKGAVEMIKNQPLFGFGYGTFPYFIGWYVTQLPEMDAHNTYLIIAAEMGIPALVIFIIILLVLIKNSWWLLRHARDRYFKAFALGALGGLFGLIVANLFGSRLNTEEVSAYFWLYSGLIMAAVRMKRKGCIE